jgi:hypothetical protein
VNAPGWSIRYPGAVTLDELFTAVHGRFPAISQAADRQYERKFGEPVQTYLWFESLADALNA